MRSRNKKIILTFSDKLKVTWSISVCTNIIQALHLFLKYCIRVGLKIWFSNSCIKNVLRKHKESLFKTDFIRSILKSPPRTTLFLSAFILFDKYCFFTMSIKPSNVKHNIGGTQRGKQHGKSGPSKSGDYCISSKINLNPLL